MQQFETPGGVGRSGVLQPHRGAMILAFGILGVVACFPFGVVAWAMGNRDLRAIDAGMMDPSGRDMTQIGRIMGIVITCLVGGMLLLYVLFFIVMLVMMLITAILAAGAAGSL